jgi:hypothetical protein
MENPTVSAAETKEPRPIAVVAWPVAAQLSVEGIDFTVPQADLESIAAIQSKITIARNDAGIKYTREAAYKEYSRLSKQVWAAAYEAGTKFEDVKVVNREVLVAEYEERAAIARKSHQDGIREAVQLCRPIMRAVKDSITKAISTLEKEEQTTADIFGCAYTPSPRLQVLKKLVLGLDHKLKAESVGEPATLLPMLKF